MTGVMKTPLIDLTRPHSGAVFNAQLKYMW